MILITELYNAWNLRRHAENLTCLHENLGNPHLNQIHVFIHDGTPLRFINPKLNVVPVNRKPTFKELLKYSEKFKEPTIIANSDIIFDETIARAENIKEKEFYCITRYDIKDDGGIEFKKSGVSQDAWIFKPPIKIKQDVKMVIDRDNRIAKVMKDAGYIVRNPAKDIHIFHFHTSGYHNKDQWNERQGGPYLGIEPSGLLDEPHYVEIQDFGPDGQPIT